MLISVCKMIQRIRRKVLEAHLREAGLAWRSEQTAWLAFLLRQQPVSERGCSTLSVVNVFAPAQIIKCILLLPLNLISFHVIIFCSIMFLMVYKMFQKIDASLFKSTLKKMLYQQSFHSFYWKHHNNQNLLCFFELSVLCT